MSQERLKCNRQPPEHLIYEQTCTKVCEMYNLQNEVNQVKYSLFEAMIMSLPMNELNIKLKAKVRATNAPGYAPMCKTRYGQSALGHNDYLSR